ncbi:endonuclease/exonuclease/phosphatase family protein [Armatimonas sp.]|uniref:endonuclease/exonuclease/phosphatase family protein n=1 Tax=Armatimonas sp. TaxID=1872638 RepID=UPI00286C7B20|nr:endonuclease/exonuclease/phosphatase family protein [Armatimonas sp.]
MKRFRLWLSWLLPGFSGLLLGFLTLCYATRTDALAAVTVVPVWCWPLPGGLLAGVRWKRRRTRGLWALWALFSLLFVDELRPLTHPLRWLSAPSATQKAAGTWRVVSLNCAGGDPKAADEVRAWKPDVVLLQEIPSPESVRALAENLYGSRDACVLGLDTAVLSRNLTAVPLPRTLQRYATVAKTPQGTIASVRLTPSILRVDFWSSNCWQAHTENRQARRAELRAVAEVLPRNGALLVGGDLNAPAGDGVFTELIALKLQDAWPLAGLDWGNTIANDLPIHRIDQLWLREHSPRALIAVKTQNSDHRMLICDLE